MTPPLATVVPDPSPVEGQLWRFRDGREGVVATVNSAVAVVYVGPQSFTIPRGDWPEAFRDAVLVPPPATLTAKMTVADVAAGMCADLETIGRGAPPAPAGWTGAPDPAVLAELDHRLAIVDAGEMTYRPAADVVADLRVIAASPSPEQVLDAGSDESLTIAPTTDVVASTPSPTPAAVVTPGRPSRRDRKRQP